MQLQSTIEVPRQTSLYVFMVHSGDYVHVCCEFPGKHCVIFNHKEYRLARFAQMESLKAVAVNMYQYIS
jgi:hypothetical protein